MYLVTASTTQISGLMQHFQVCAQAGDKAIIIPSRDRLHTTARQRQRRKLLGVDSDSADSLPYAYKLASRHGSSGAERAEWADVPFLRFDDEPQGLFTEWLTGHMMRLRAGDEPGWMESHLAKYPGLLGRLALVLHPADGYSGMTAAETLAKALNWTEYLEGHARRIYAPLLTTD